MPPLPVPADPALADVYGAAVTVGEVPRQVRDAVLHNPWLQATVDEAVLDLEEVGRFHIVDGRHVTLDLRDGVSAADCAIWLRGIVGSIVLTQQGRFALHASTVRIHDRVVAIAGGSGAGKSTTAAALFARGHELLTDEISAVDVVAGRAIVSPSPRALRLHPDVADRLGLVVPPPLPSDPGGKSVVTLPSAEPAPLDLLVVIRRSPEGTTAPRATSLGRLAAVRAVGEHTYRPFLVALQPDVHHHWAVGIAGRVPVAELERPAVGWTVDAVADLVESLTDPSSATLASDP